MLVERHAQALARFVSSVGERECVDEVVQDTFVRAFGAIDSFRGESSFRTWLFTIAKRLLLDRRRAERRSRTTSSIEEGDAVTQFDDDQIRRAFIQPRHDRLGDGRQIFNADR